MKQSSKIALGVAAGAAALVFLKKKKEGSVAGIGEVDNEWGANEMRLSVLNIEPLYYRYKNHVLRLLDMGQTEEQIKNSISFYLKNDIKRGRIYLSSGMGRGENARSIAAKDIYDAFYEDWEYERNH